MRATKGIKARNVTIAIRLSVDELELIDQLCEKRKLTQSKYWSRSDVIMLAIKHANGVIF